MPYYRPAELSTALDILTQAGGKIVAGGTDLYPSAQRGVEPDFYLDVTAIHGLADITHTDNGTRIGASATWSQLVSANLPTAFDCLKEAAVEVGSVQIQNAGTLVGNVCNASPAADGIPPLIALDAQVELQSAARGARVMALSDFVQGVRKTDRADDELLTAILIPPVHNSARSAFAKLGSRRYLVISITMCAVVVHCDADGQIIHAKVAVGACSPVAQRLYELEQDLIGKTLDQVDISPEHLQNLSPIDDVRGSAEYRLDVVAKQCARTLRRAIGHD